MEIQISVNNKIAKQTNDVIPVCGNKDYTVVFAFDDEWDGLDTKTARFRYNSTYTDVVFTGDRCAMPSIQQAKQVQIGVYAGDLHTTTPAEVNMQWSILCGTGTPAAPSDDVYNQIMALLNGLSGAKPATAERLGLVKVGDNLKITEDGTLSVDTVEAMEEDNTRPITSAAVYTEVGNIAVLLRNL